MQYVRYLHQLEKDGGVKSTLGDNRRMKMMPVLKYPGGKERELPQIASSLPPKIDSLYEPFVGGGSVFLNINAQRYFINDKSSQLMGLYSCIKNRDNEFEAALETIDRNWERLTEVVVNNKQELLQLYKKDRAQAAQLADDISAFVLKHSIEFNGLFKTSFNYCIEQFFHTLNKSMRDKITRMKKLEGKRGLLSDDDIIKNIESSLKAAFYTHCRYLMNNRKKLMLSNGTSAAIYLFVRDMCYSSMFRYNASGDFNVPYGGISYNRKNLRTRLDYYRSVSLKEKLEKTELACDDFATFLDQQIIGKDDFIFVDPPYDSDFSTYANNSFGKKDQERLARWLIESCVANFMVVIKQTELIDALYAESTPCRNGNRIHKTSFEKKYQVSFKNRNNRNAEHLLITNY